jgi:short-subunit dehydrogenase
MLAVPPGSFALVTGASSGIGEAIAARLAARGVSLILAARSVSKLEELRSTWSVRYGIDVETVAVDLSDADGPMRLWAATEGAGRRVYLLVNNAGFGLNGAEADLPLEKTAEMIRLNVGATAELTHRFLGAMRSRGRGWILNVASTAAFVPGPWFGTYSATKAFVLSFSLALHEEAKRDGVTVTCLCPGYTRTGFHAAAGMKPVDETPIFPVMSADAVAEAGLAALERGRRFVVPHFLDRLWISSLRLVPRSVPPLLAAAFFRRSRLPGA